MIVAQRGSPFGVEHDASVRRAMRDRAEMPPFHRLLSWFTGRWTEEVPHSIHGAGVEWDTPGRIIRADGGAVTDPGGGNELGSPKFSPAFRRRVLEDRHADTEHPSSDGRQERADAYSTPMHQTVAYIGRSRPLCAAWLRALGRTGGDWRAVGQLGLTVDERGLRVPLPDEYAQMITSEALRRAWSDFRDAPVASSG